MFPSEFWALITLSSGRFKNKLRISSLPRDAIRWRQVSPRLSTMFRSAFLSNNSSTISFLPFEQAYWRAECPCQFLWSIAPPWFSMCLTISMLPPSTARINGVAFVSSSRLMYFSKSPALINCLPRYSKSRSRPERTVQWSSERRFYKN